MISMIEAILMNIPNPIKDLKSQNEKLNNELEEIRNENTKLKEEYDECFSEFEKLRKENQELDEYNDELLEKIETYEREGKFAVERYVEDIFDRLVEEIADNVRKMDESDISYPSFDFDDYI